MKFTAWRSLVTILFVTLVLSGTKTYASVYEIAYSDGIGNFDLNLTLGSSGPNGSFQVTDLTGTSTFSAIVSIDGVGSDPGFDNLFYPNASSLVDDQGIEFLFNFDQTRGLRFVDGAYEDVLSDGAFLPVSGLTIVSINGNPTGNPTPPLTSPTPVGSEPVPEKGQLVSAVVACGVGLVVQGVYFLRSRRKPRRV